MVLLFGGLWPYIALYYLILHYIALYRIVSHYIALYRLISHCIAYIALYRIKSPFPAVIDPNSFGLVFLLNASWPARRLTKCLTAFLNRPPSRIDHKQKSEKMNRSTSVLSAVQEQCSESLIIQKNPKSTTFSFDSSELTISKHTSNTHCASNGWPIWAQKVPKEV